MKQYLDLMNKVLAEGTPKSRPYRHWHVVDFRPPDAFQLAGRFPVGDHQKMSSAFDHS